MDASIRRPCSPVFQDLSCGFEFLSATPRGLRLSAAARWRQHRVFSPRRWRPPGARLTGASRPTSSPSSRTTQAPLLPARNGALGRSRHERSSGTAPPETSDVPYVSPDAVVLAPMARGGTATLRTRMAGVDPLGHDYRPDGSRSLRRGKTRGVNCARGKASNLGESDSARPGRWTRRGRCWRRRRRPRR